MGRVEAVAIPNKTDADMSKVSVDDVSKVSWGSNERVHDRSNIGASAHVLAELAPILRDALADWICVTDIGVVGADAVALCLGPTARENRQLTIEREGRKTIVRPDLIHERNECRLIGRRLRRS